MNSSISSICGLPEIPSRKIPAHQRLRLAITAWVLPLLLLVSAGSVKADQTGDFKFTSNGTSVTITGYTGTGGNVNIPGTINGLPVTSIGDSTFSYRINLTEVTIPSSVTSIGNNAFSACTGLTGVTIPNSVTSIGLTAFSGCTGLTGVTIPNSVTSIGLAAFSGCTGLTGVTIPSSVTSIGDSTFSYCFGLTSVTIPNSVTSIGNYMFQSCFGLTSVTIPNSVTSIGNYTFQSCSGLTSVTIPNSVTSIGNYTFLSCSGLTGVTIPNSVTSIGGGAFSGCGLTSVSIPSSVTSVGDSTFSLCRGLTSVTIPDSVTSIGDNAFNATSLRKVTIPSSVISIGQYAFSSCPGLTSVIIPAGVTSIGGDSFHGCTNLFQASFFGNAPAMGPNVFYGAASSFRVYFLSDKTGFTSPTWQGYPALVFPDPLILNDPASVGVRSGESTTLSVTAIGTEPLAYQWYQGSSGTTTTLVGGNSSSYTTPALTASSFYWVKVTNAANPGGADSNTATVAITTPPVVATGFPTRISATSATLTGTVNPNYSATTAQFEYGLTTAYGRTANVVLAPNDGSTTQNVVAGFDGLQEGQTYHYRLIATNSAGTSVGDDMTLVPDARSAAFNFAIVDGTVTITRYFENSYDYAVDIPATINGLPVTRIGENAFYGCSQLDRVTIPHGVISIGDGAFWQCLGLSSVSIPDSVISIGGGAFSTCRLASVTIPGSVTSIGGGAFSGNSGLTRATFMGNAPAMGADVFAQSAMGFGIRYYFGAAGFTTPTWMGYPSLVGAPDIALEQAGLELTDGGLLNCGAVRTGTAESRLIAIRNTREHDLTGLVLSIDGTNSGNFAVGPLEKSTLAPGESTTFGVTFSPTAGGIREASLHVARSATDAYPFDVMLTGTGLSVTDGGTTPWTAQSTITHGGSAAARSGSITHSQESWMQTTVTGPGTLTFWWKVSSQASADYLELYRDGSLQNRISGEVDWKLYAQNIPAGSHTVKWRYMKNASTTSGQDAGWLDEVVFLPAPFVPVVATGSATGITASTATLNAVVNPNGAATTAQFQYGLSKDYGRGGSVTLSPNTGSATVATSVNIRGLQPGWTYHYRLVATNASGTSLGADGIFTTEASSGPFKFTMNDGVITISGYTGPGGALIIPSTINGLPVTSVGPNAFQSKTSLTSVAIPAGVTSIGSSAFHFCSNLTRVSFVGDAPSIGTSAFGSVASGFAVHYFNGAAGFTSPTWNGYATVNMGASTPVASWLVENGLPYNTSLQDDSDGDGVSLLMSYALDLDPNRNPGGSLPEPVIESNRMTLDFYAGTAGVTYAVETSTDMQQWTSEGVLITAPDAKKVRTASVGLTGSSRYMRLVVSR